MISGLDVSLRSSTESSGVPGASSGTCGSGRRLLSDAVGDGERDGRCSVSRVGVRTGDRNGEDTNGDGARGGSGWTRGLSYGTR